MRFRWIEGQVAAAAGRSDAAIELLSGVRDHFLRQGVLYDSALVTLELAAAFLDMHSEASGRRILARWGISHFAPAQDAIYEPIRRMANDAAAVRL